MKYLKVLYIQVLIGIALGVLTGWPLMMMLFADRMRNLGRYTFVDVLAYRLQGQGVRISAAVSALCINVMYAVAQLVGAGKLLSLLLGIGYTPALLMITGLMALYVIMGGMLITTWIQILKATLMLLGAFVLTVLVLGHFGFSADALFAADVQRIFSTLSAAERARWVALSQRVVVAEAADRGVSV